MASSSQLDTICYIQPQLSLPVFCRSYGQKYANSNLEEIFFKFHIEGYIGGILQHTHTGTHAHTNACTYTYTNTGTQEHMHVHSHRHTCICKLM